MRVPFIFFHPVYVFARRKEGVRFNCNNLATFILRLSLSPLSTRGYARYSPTLSGTLPPLRVSINSSTTRGLAWK